MGSQAQRPSRTLSYYPSGEGYQNSFYLLIVSSLLDLT
jgi:hypothetical protein